MPLARPIEELRRRPSCQVAVIGSGYGGSIVAARLGQALGSLDLVLLERGKEWVPGTFPDSWWRVSQHYRTKSRPLGLYELSAGEGVDVIRGSGLGGTSLINANVAIRPADEILAQSVWPATIRNDPHAALDRYFQRAAQVLGIRPHPRGEDLAKVGVLKRFAARESLRFELVDLAVHFDPRPGLYPVPTFPGVYVDRAACNDCGDCISGCNVGAKNTLYANYLPAAVHHGCRVFTQCEVKLLERTRDAAGPCWRIHYLHHTEEGRATTVETLLARIVVVAAGTLGTTELLLRSREGGLSFSKRLAQGFSANGDFFSIAANGRTPTGILGSGRHDDARARIRPGPSIVAAVHCHESDSDLRNRYTVQDFSIPRAAEGTFRRTILALKAFARRSPGARGELGARIVRTLRDIASWCEDGASNHSMFYLLMVNDGAAGELRLRGDTVGVFWPKIKDAPVFARVDEEMRAQSTAIGACHVGAVSWHLPRKTLLHLTRRRLVAPHPLGGCRMGDDADGGVTDHLGRVYDGEGAFHDGLYTADASLIPTPLLVNPFFTISALSERIADHLVATLRTQPPVRP